jgi:hypothetical protein
MVAWEATALPLGYTRNRLEIIAIAERAVKQLREQAKNVQNLDYSL